eukprot:TRINITY_DN4905_c3_g1_i2.p1 TRINITY_DN4905_c3_g1~~TRINITY_DN4905_c3_g1_i2.p1  ORF type:complete len:433 (+),score=95.76 TRINITY_DN4905_c3_g1_i2:97-1299(+)
MAKFLGATSRWTTAIDFVGEKVDPNKAIPCFHIMNSRGDIVEGATAPAALVKNESLLKKMYESMIRITVMDNVLYDAQRQGRISFYMTSYGEEATHIGSAAPLHPDDMVWAQYREVGVLMWRGFTYTDIMNQCYGNHYDLGKGRQMPVHYGSAKLNFQTISSPLATQIPQAVGGAYAFKIQKKPNVVIVYFGEGAASEGDFHAAMNFAATLEVPCIFFCRNNGYAISTSTHDQYRGDGIAGRGPAYGMATIRVDGNDLFAVYSATEAARAHALANNKPVLIEAMTYRGGHHSTSDDASRYRSTEEKNFWLEELSPLTRFGRYLSHRGLWNEVMEHEFRDKVRLEVLDALRKAEPEKKPSLRMMFTDVYDTLPPHLQKQQQELVEHLDIHGERYGLDKFAK